MFITLKLICFLAFSVSGITEIESPNFCILQVQERKNPFLKKRLYSLLAGNRKLGFKHQGIV